jgi:hypothetical protein
MKWLPDGPCAFQREDGRYNIVRSPQHGFPATYTLVRLGAKRLTRDGRAHEYIGSTILATARVADDGERKAAIESLMEHTNEPA